MDFSVIKHFSFDLWLTIIKSNPQFKTERTKYFHQYYNSLNKSIEEVAKIFRQVDIMCNSINEKTGSNIDTDEMYLMIIYLLNDNNSFFKEMSFADLYIKMEALFFKYPPVFYDENTASCLSKIKELPFVTMSVMSNTAFIKGSTLRLLLQKLRIADYFSFQLYSDEVMISKPQKAIFEIMNQNIMNVRKDDFLNSYQIMHVGDNPIADIHGAVEAGIKSFLINSNHKTIADIFN